MGTFNADGSWTSEVPGSLPEHRMFTQREVDQACVEFMNDRSATLLPRLVGTGSERATVTEFNLYLDEAISTGRVLQTRAVDGFYDYSVV